MSREKNTEEKITEISIIDEFTIRDKIYEARGRGDGISVIRGKQ